MQYNENAILCYACKLSYCLELKHGTSGRCKMQVVKSSATQLKAHILSFFGGGVQKQ